MTRLQVAVMAAVFSLMLFGPVFAESGSGYEAAKNIVEKATPCSQLTDEDLEHVGDYYMELMHPGAAHKQMDDAMGGEGSESLKQMHILIARRWHCGDAVGLGMMGMMMGSGIMGGGWNAPTTGQWRGMSAGMMSWNGGWMFSSAWLTMALVWIFLIAGIAAFIRYFVKK